LAEKSNLISTNVQNQRFGQTRGKRTPMGGFLRRTWTPDSNARKRGITRKKKGHNVRGGKWLGKEGERKKPAKAKEKNDSHRQAQDKRSGTGHVESRQRLGTV